MKSKNPILTILEPFKKVKSETPAYTVGESFVANYDKNNFPIGFIPDFPAVITSNFAKDLIVLDDWNEGTFDIDINLKEFLENMEHPWLVFTFALHALILAPNCRVFFRNMNTVDFSEEMDRRRIGPDMQAVKNFVTYLHTTRGDRPGRVFEPYNGSFIPLSEKTFNEIPPGFSSYYKFWLERPYRSVSETSRIPDFYTHPYDHLPVKNLTPRLNNVYLTRTQIKAKGGTVPDIDDAVLMHDQIRTVALRPYWHIRTLQKTIYRP